MAGIINDFVEINKRLTPILNSLIVEGVLIEDIALTSGVDNFISHELGRKPQGYFLVNKNANADVWTSSTTNSFPAQHLILRASATVTISFWVF